MTDGAAFRVEERAVQRAVRIVDAEALAQRVEAVALARERLARHGQREHAPQARAAVRIHDHGGHRALNGLEDAPMRRIVDRHARLPERGEAVGQPAPQPLDRGSGEVGRGGAVQGEVLDVHVRRQGHAQDGMDAVQRWEGVRQSDL